MPEELVGYKIADFYLDLHNKSLSKDGQSLDIGERAFRLLQLLAEASPEPISKQSLSSLLWQETIVSDWSLFRLISDTRQLLGDDGEQQQLIKTARGIGFYLTQVTPCYGSPATVTLADHNTRPWGKWTGLSGVLVILAVLWITVQPRIQHHQLTQAVTRISQYQDNTFTAFMAQVARRNELGDNIAKRLSVKRQRQWEKFFAFYYPQMNDEERFICQQMRAMTDTGLYQNNQAILDELVANPGIYREIEGTEQLQQHLTFWLNKYHSVFKQREDMCLLYVGVEDGVPYPSGVDQRVKDWLQTRQK